MYFFFVKKFTNKIKINIYNNMDFFGKLNSKSNFGMFEKTNVNLINIICGILLILLIIILIVCLVRKDDNFSELKNKDQNENQNVDIYHVINEKCPYSRKMSDLLARNNNMIGNFNVKNIPINHPIAKKHNIAGTPSIIHDKNNKVSVGFKPLENILEDLMGKEKNYKNLEKDILFIGSMACGFCSKAKRLMDELGLDYQFIDSNSHNGLYNMKKTNSTGVPLIIKKSSNKIIKGFNEDEIKQL